MNGDGPRRGGFSLLELMVVVILIGVLGAMAVVAVRPQLDRAVMTRLLDQIEIADRAQRQRDRRSADPATLQIDRSGGKLTFDSLGRTIAVPPSLRIARTLVRGDNDAPASARLATVRYRDGGRSATYAIQFAAADPRPGGQSPSTWWVAIGGSGQTLRTTDTTLVTMLLGEN